MKWRLIEADISGSVCAGDAGGKPCRRTAVAASDNVIRIMCPNLTCKRILAVPTTARGKMVRCRGCGINLRIPTAKVAEPAPAAADANAKKDAAGKPAAAPSAKAA